jgi:hypothetical protein
MSRWGLSRASTVLRVWEIRVPVNTVTVGPGAPPMDKDRRALLYIKRSSVRETADKMQQARCCHFAFATPAHARLVFIP